MNGSIGIEMIDQSFYTLCSKLYSVYVATIGSIRYTGEGFVVDVLRRHLLCLYVTNTVNFYLCIAYRYLKTQHVISNNV